MKKGAPIYLHRSPTVVLKIAQISNGYWALFVGEKSADAYQDEREAAKAAADKITGFGEWDETDFTCPAELDDWERI